MTPTMSTTSRSAALALACAAILAHASEARGQDAIRPAETIRVVESRGVSGSVAREVVGDLLPAEVLLVQVALARAGFDPGVRSGVVDGATRSALRSFQARRGLVLICGCVSYETVVALGIRPRVVETTALAEAEPATDRTVIVDRSASVLFFVPAHHHHRKRGRCRGAGVVVGVGGCDGVFVGHAPARGAAQTAPDLARPPRGGVQRPAVPAPRGRPGVIRQGSGGFGVSTGARPARPGPR